MTPDGYVTILALLFAAGCLALASGLVWFGVGLFALDLVFGVLAAYWLTDKD